MSLQEFFSKAETFLTLLGGLLLLALLIAILVKHKWRDLQGKHNKDTSALESAFSFEWGSLRIARWKRKIPSKSQRGFRGN